VPLQAEIKDSNKEGAEINEAEGTIAEVEALFQTAED